MAAAARAVGRRPDRARTPRIGWHRHRAALQLTCEARMAVGARSACELLGGAFRKLRHSAEAVTARKKQNQQGY